MQVVRKLRGLMQSVVERIILLVFGISLAVLLVEAGFRVVYVHLPYPVQVKASGLRLWGFGGPPLGLLIDSQDFYQTCMGDERLFARILPGLSDVPIRTGPRNVWHVTSTDLGFDEIGFRTPESEGPWDGVVVGDSFTFCVGVEVQDCWVQQLAEYTGLKLANLGVTGTGSVSHLRYLEDYGWALQPKVVLWQFFLNDPRDDYNHVVKRLQGCPRPQANAEPNVPSKEVRECLSRTFATYVLVVRPALRYVFPQLAGPEAATINYEQVMTTNNERLMVDSPRREKDDSQLLTGIDLTKEAILSAARQASERNSRFLLVLVPRNSQVYADFLPFDQLIASAHVDDVVMDNLVAFAEAHEIQYVDLRSALREAAARGDDLYPAYDGHWSPSGNRLVAEFLADTVAEAVASLDASEGGER